MNPKSQIIEQAIMDLEKNREVVRQVREEREKLNPGPDYYERVEELDVAMEKAREERVNIAVRLFRDYLDYQGNPVVGNPNEAFYDPNPTPIFSVGDFHRGPGIPRMIPAITGARTKHSSTGRSTLRRIDKFIKQLKDKMKRRKDLQENNLFQLTEEKLKQMILDEMKSNLPLADQEKLFQDIDRIKQLYAEITRLKASMRDAYDRAYDSFDYDDPYTSPELDEIRSAVQEEEKKFVSILDRYNISPYKKNKYGYTVQRTFEEISELLKKKFRRRSL